MIAQRLRQARLAAGLTQDELVKSLAAFGQRITKAGISKYEKGGSVPGAAFLAKAARSLGVKTAYFIAEPSVTVEWKGFRKNSRFGKGEQEHVKAWASQYAERWIGLRDALHPGEKPDFPVSKTEKTPDGAERAAVFLRSQWRLGDISIDSVTRLIEDRGGIVAGLPEANSEFDGLSGVANDATPVLVTSLATPIDRRRFNLAHELGHVVMNLGESKEENNLAHRFAAAFLVPAETARRELGKKRHSIELGELRLLKEKYGVSMQAWIRRARDLDIINDSLYMAFMTMFSRQQWRKQEPYPAKFPEQALRLKQMVLRAVTEGVISKEQAEDLCPEAFEGKVVGQAQTSRPLMTPKELMRLPKAERDKVLAQAAAMAEAEYRTRTDVAEFSSFPNSDVDNG